MLVDLGAPARGPYRAIGVHQRQVAALAVHQIDIELAVEFAPQRAFEVTQVEPTIVLVTLR